MRGHVDNGHVYPSSSSAVEGVRRMDCWPELKTDRLEALEKNKRLVRPGEYYATYMRIII